MRLGARVVGGDLLAHLQDARLDLVGESNTFITPPPCGTAIIACPGGRRDRSRPIAGMTQKPVDGPTAPDIGSPTSSPGDWTAPQQIRLEPSQPPTFGLNYRAFVCRPAGSCPHPERTDAHCPRRNGMKSTFGRFALLAVLALVFPIADAGAQGVTSGSMSGIVNDPQGAAGARAPPSSRFTCRRAPATKPSPAQTAVSRSRACASAGPTR